MVTVKIEGQEYQLSDEIVNGGTTVQESDRLLRDALRPNFEVAAGASFLRETRLGQPYITLVKQPGSKGGQHGLQRLHDVPQWINPVLSFAAELQRMEMCHALDHGALLAVQGRLDEALREGMQEEEQISRALRVLAAAPAMVGMDVPPGL